MNGGKGAGGKVPIKGDPDDSDDYYEPKGPKGKGKKRKTMDEEAGETAGYEEDQTLAESSRAGRQHLEKVLSEVQKDASLTTAERQKGPLQSLPWDFQAEHLAKICDAANRLSPQEK
jgi:hypothetical protein